MEIIGKFENKLVIKCDGSMSENLIQSVQEHVKNGFDVKFITLELMAKKFILPMLEVFIKNDEIYIENNKSYEKFYSTDPRYYNSHISWVRENDLQTNKLNWYFGPAYTLGIKEPVNLEGFIKLEKSYQMYKRETKLKRILEK